MGSTLLWGNAEITTKGGGYYTNFPRSVILPVFQNYQNMGHLLNIMFIFVRYLRSWAAMTPVKYERDQKHPTGAHKLRNIDNEIINEQSFSDPHPGLCHDSGSQQRCRGPCKCSKPYDDSNH